MEKEGNFYKMVSLSSNHHKYLPSLLCPTFSSFFSFKKKGLIDPKWEKKVVAERGVKLGTPDTTRLILRPCILSVDIK